MAHTIKNKRALLARVRRIKGQSEALEKALDREDECGAVLQQIAAIRGAVNGLMVEVLEGHIREHLVPGGGHDAGQEEDLAQVIRLLRSYMK